MPVGEHCLAAQRGVNDLRERLAFADAILSDDDRETPREHTILVREAKG